MTPLAYYLKALGILRIVSQKDKKVRGYWKDDIFHLKTSLTKDDIINYILNEYEPTPVVAPWNGGSGFYPKHNETAKEAIDKIKNGTENRLKAYRDTINEAFKIIAELNITGKPKDEEKENIIKACRNRYPDEALEWIDATVVLTDDGIKYPPLLGTGGNDGRLDFTSNFMQRLNEVFDLTNKTASISWIGNSLFGDVVNNLKRDIAIGQFFPSATGGLNAESGIESDSLANPWDFILLIEGSLFFATSSVKRLQTNSYDILSYPFSVKASSAGYSSASLTDDEHSRAEIWMPSWDNPASVDELKLLMSEGRCQVGKRHARNGVDFARAIATLGVDRGIKSFQRYSFMKRNGKAYFATPLGQFEVSRQPQADILIDIDQWLDAFTDKAKSGKAPQSIKESLMQLDSSIIQLCKNRGPLNVQKVLIALGRCEKAMVKSYKWTMESHLHPIFSLSNRWIQEANDGSTEFRLACSLASIYTIREYVEPVTTIKGFVNWKKNDENVVWSEGNAIDSFNNIMSRQIMNGIRSKKELSLNNGYYDTDLSDIADFIEEKVDLNKMVDLFFGLILVNWNDIKLNGSIEIESKAERSIKPEAIYGLLKLCFAGKKVRNINVPVVSKIHRYASTGNCANAIRAAITRLRGSELIPALTITRIPNEKCKRIAASLLFSLSEDSIEKITNMVLRAKENE